jgi:hypothetical protein
VLRRDVRRGLKKLSGPYDLIFLDPPYGYLLEREALGAIAQPGLLAPGGVAVVEHAGRETVTLPRDAEGLLVAGETRPYGDTAVTFFSPAPVASAPAPTVVDDEPARSSLVPPSGRRVAIYAGQLRPAHQRALRHHPTGDAAV